MARASASSSPSCQHTCREPGSALHHGESLQVHRHVVGEVLKFARKGRSGNVFNVSLLALSRPFEPKLAAGALAVVITLGGRGRRDDISSCRFYDAKVFAK